MVLSKYVREAFEASLEPLSLDPLEALFDQENNRMKHHERKESKICATATAFIYWCLWKGNELETVMTWEIIMVQVFGAGLTNISFLDFRPVQPQAWETGAECERGIKGPQSVLLPVCSAWR